MSPILQTSTVYNTAPLVDEGNYVYWHTQTQKTHKSIKHMEIRIESSPQHRCKKSELSNQ